MEARVFKYGKFVVLELSGRVDDFHNAVLAEELKTIISTGKKYLAVTLFKVSYLSPHCVSHWLDVHDDLLDRGGTIALVGAHSDAMQLIHSVKLGDVMPVCESMDELEKLTIVPHHTKNFDRKAAFARLLKNFVRSFFPLIFLVMAFSFWLNDKAFAEQEIVFEVTLEKAQKIAREKSPLMRLSRAKFEEKDAAFEIAKRGPLPKLTSTFGYLYQSNPSPLTDLLNRESKGFRSGSDPELIDKTQVKNNVKVDKNIAIVGIGATQILYAGGYFDARKELADKERELSTLETQLMESEIDSLVRELFIGVIFLEQQFLLSQAKVNAIKAKADALRVASESKAISEIVYGESEIEWMAAVRSSEEARGELELRRAQLNTLLGRDDSAPLRLIIDPQENAQLSEGNVSFALLQSHNAKISKGLKQISMADSYMRVVKSQEMFVPKAFAFGGVDHFRGIGQSERFLNWTLGLGVLVPLSDGGVQAEETRKALALRSQAEAGYEIEEAKLRQELRETTLKINRATADANAALRAVTIAKKTLEEAEKATLAKQLPAYKLEEIRVAKIESEIKLVLAKANLAKWRSVLRGLAGIDK